jgi:hypothetical protein
MAGNVIRENERGLSGYEFVYHPILGYELIVADGSGAPPSPPEGG